MIKTPPQLSPHHFYTLFTLQRHTWYLPVLMNRTVANRNSPPTIAAVGYKPDYSFFFWTCFLISMNFPHTALLPIILPGNLSSTHLPNHLITISKPFLRHHLNHLPNISPRTQNQPAPTCSFQTV